MDMITDFLYSEMSIEELYKKVIFFYKFRWNSKRWIWRESIYFKEDR